MSVNDVFTFTWVIENFNLCPHECGERLCSPKFTIKNFQNTSWYLVLYRTGRNTNYDGMVSLFLFRANDGPQSIEIEFILSIQETTKQAKHTFNKCSAYWWHKFIELKPVEHLNDCIVECHMRLCTKIVSASSHCLLPRFSNSQFNNSELMKEICSTAEREIHTVLKSLQLYANQCLVRTRFSVERRIFTCIINDYIYPGSKRKQNIPVTFSSETLVVTLFMSEKNCKDVLEMEIHIESNKNLSYSLICKVELLDSERKICDSAEKQHLFRKHMKDKSWNFDYSFNWNDIKGKEANLRFTLAFSNGRYFSDPNWVAEENNCVDLRIFPNNVAEDMHPLYTEKKFCDVTIQMKDEKSIDVHKAVLCSRSPVFAAMFESGMKESETHVIEISDLNYDTVSQMVSFMYNDFVAGLDEESAKQLFAAADKYEIKSLKDTCRYVLKNNLNLKNICSILLLADAHQDDDLIHSAIAFFAENKNDILKSVQWEELEENNMLLALETLKKTCINLYPW